METWNKTLLVKHLWNVASQKESMWVKWLNVIKLKKRFIWDIDIEKKDNCGWKCLLNLRSWVGDHIRYRIGDGKSINVWHDRWYTDTPLSNFFLSKKMCFMLVSVILVKTMIWLMKMNGSGHIVGRTNFLG